MVFESLGLAQGECIHPAAVPGFKMYGCLTA